VKKSIILSIILVLLSSHIWSVSALEDIDLMEEQHDNHTNIQEEIVDLRTPSSKTFLSDKTGEYIQEIYSDGIHYESVDGEYYEINTDLIDLEQLDVTEYSIDGLTLDSSVSTQLKSLAPVSTRNKEDVFRIKPSKAASEKFANLLANQSSKKGGKRRDVSFYSSFQVPYELDIPKNLQDGYSIGYNGQALTFIPSNIKSSIGKIDVDQKNVIHYENPWPSTDLTLTVLPNGIKEEIILKDRKAPNNFSFEILGDIDESFRSGDLSISPAWLEDHVGVRRDVQMSIRKDGNKNYLEMTWDETGLEYPILIDPNVSIGYSHRFHQCSNYTNQNLLQDGMLVGTKNGNNCSSYMVFNTSSIPKDVQITSASLRMGYHANGNLNVAIKQMTSPVTRNLNRPLQYTNKNQQSRLIESTIGSKGNVANWNITNIVSNSYRNGVLMVGLYRDDNGQTSSIYMDVNDSYGAPYLSVTYSTENKNYYSYDQSNRLNYISQNSKVTGFFYDDNGKLVSRDNFHYDDNMIANGNFILSDDNWDLDPEFEVSSRYMNGYSLNFSGVPGSNHQSSASSYPIVVGLNSTYTISGYMLKENLVGEVYITWTEFNSHYGRVRSGTKLISSTFIPSDEIWGRFFVSITTSGLAEWITIDIVAAPSTHGDAYVSSLRLIPAQN